MDNPESMRPIHPEQSVVLIAEDEVTVRNIVRMILEREGYFVLTGNDGEEALYIAETFPGSIHLLLSDIRMPVVDGFELTRRIVLRRPEIKVVLMSGETLPSSDGVPFLRKPFGSDALRQKVRNVLIRPVLFPPAGNP